MINTLQAVRPLMRPLGQDTVSKIIDEAFLILENIGIFVENQTAVNLLQEAGAKIGDGRVFIPAQLVKKCLQTAPSSIKLYDAEGNLQMDLSGDNIHFDPGSAAINILDGDTGEIRKAVTEDFVNLCRLVENLDNIAAQSTAFICSDVAEEIADRYRLYLALRFCSKPVVTGTFQVDAFQDMKEMLIAIRGSESALREKPLAIFDACPSPPLKWSNLTTQTLIECARSGIPSEMVSMPLTGATAPITLLGSITQHCAECLCGIVISQLACEGAPVIWGGSPAVFDMKKGTTPMGAIETMMIDSAYAQVGKHLNLPTHAYMGLSDSKAMDAQAGLETGMGAVLAALSGINVISGLGMLDFESCQSLEKLVFDNEIAGMSLRLVKGIEIREEPFAIHLFPEYEKAGHFLSLPHTMKWFRKEFYYPGNCIDRHNLGAWQEKGSKNSWDRSREEVQRILSKGKKYSPSREKIQLLEEIIKKSAQKYGMKTLPNIAE